MSLKHVHVLFICVSVLLTLFMGWWALNQYNQASEVKFLLTSGGSFLLSLTLIVYGYSFLQKLKSHKI